MTNLLFIFTDEQRHDTLNDPALDMPNLNRLAAQSTLFERAYCTQPICTPSRSSILCGLYPHATGCTWNNIALPTDTPTLAEMLRDDFATGYFGKWHLGDEIFAQHGFDEWVSIEDDYIRFYSAGRDRSARSDYHHFLSANGFEPDLDKDGRVFSRGFACRVPEQYGKPAFLAQEASRFLREKRDQPFVLYVNFLEPHMPFFSPRDDQYDPASVPLPENYDAIPTDDQHPRAHYVYHQAQQPGFEGHNLTSEAGWRRLIANYRGLNSLVDTHVGTILDTLAAEGLADDTIVVFTSDHGDQMGSHQLVAKHQIFEESARVPLMIRLPGQRDGRRVTGPISQVDLVPTLLDLLGQPVPDGLHGTSRRALLEHGGEPGDDVFYSIRQHETTAEHANRPDDPILHRLTPAQRPALDETVRVIVTPDGWKFSHSPAGFHELYNLNDDPGERHNRAAAEPERVAALTARLRDWQARVGDV